MLGILRALTQLLHIWWTKDRIRVARSEGRLFRIRVDDHLLIEDRIYHVIARHDSETREMACVSYELAEEQGETRNLWQLDFTMQNEVANLSYLGRQLEICCDRIVILENKVIA